MAALNTTPIGQFTHNFSTHSLSDFFSQSISRFVPRQENLSYIITETRFDKFSDLTKIGEVAFDNADELIVFSCKYNGPITSRSSRRQQFDIAKKVLREDFKDGAIFVYHDQYKNFRFSFIRKNYSEKGENRYSPWKRYTYFVDPAETNRTFKERIGNCTFSDLENIQQAFSVEKLTKDFYNRLFEWFQWTVSDEVGITYPNDTTIAEDDREKLEVQLIRLTTRLLFCWFIKQKKLIPDSLFDQASLSTILKDFDPMSKTDGSFYNAILQNLFFATLNKSIDERAFAKLMNTRDLKTLYRYAELFSIPEDEVLKLFKPVPFLNGGLFECLDKENPDGKKIYLDGFSRNDKKAANGNFRHRAFIPNCVFFDEKKGIIPILEQYNFTVEENDPNEVQVALDPELLGNVFENLLGAFNKETRDSARKQSGSFYTPREIVSYMVDESLVAYLKNKLPEVDEETIREFFEQEQLPECLQNNTSLREQISTTLRSVKILDPACGSGAFPMGILNRMLQVLKKLEMTDADDSYEEKLHLIEECIYGIDIQPIATQISKLRFFISLIVEEKRIDFTKENYGVRSLPNLETKFVAANTLITLNRKPKNGQYSLENIQMLETKKELLDIRKKHFYVGDTNEKRLLRDNDKRLRKKLSQQLQENSEFAAEDTEKLVDWNPYDQNESASFFDLDWMFGLEEGFDIVIGNPPYIQLQNDGGRLAQLYQDKNYETYTRKGDIYSLFYERGWQLLKEKGSLCFITSNKWMRAGYGESTRKFFAEKTNPLLLIDFSGQKIFEAATVDPNILLFSKAKNEKQTFSYTVKEKMLAKLSDTVKQNATKIAFDTSENWVILSEMEQRIKAKIEAIGTPLKEWDIQINYGIKTGYNEAFIINGKKREELIAEDPKSAEIIRPILRGRDIKKYSYDSPDLWLINTHNGIREQNIKPVDINRYPAIKKHLDQFYPQLEKRLDKGITPYHLRNCAYMDDFSKQKITYMEIMTDNPQEGYEFPCFSFDLESHIVLNSAHILTGNIYELRYIIGVLNSKLGRLLVKNYTSQLQQRQFVMLRQNVLDFQIPKNVNFEPISELVNQILRGKNSLKDIKCLEQNLNDLVYHLFSLTPTEVAFIESQ